MVKGRLISLLAAAAVLSLALSACGSDVPSGGVAKIGDAVIKKDEFNHWLQAAARGQQAPGSAGAVSVPDPPKFEKCIAAKGKTPVPKGSQKPTAAQVKEQCKQEYDSLKQQVMQFLISAEWIEQEAKSRDIKITDEEIRKQFEDQKKQSFPNDKDYKDFLKTSGQTESDLLFRVKLDVLSNKVREKVIADKGKVSDDDVKEYYEKNKERFAQPERRDLAVVLTKTKGKADEAKAALSRGGRFAPIAKKLSIDEASKSQGGKLPGVAKGQQEKAFDDAIFAAKKDELQGPVKTQFGFYVFKVTKITPKSQQTVDQAKETIKNLLKSEREQKALDEFVKKFREKYKDETKCAKDYVIEDCSNAPKPKTDTGPASGGAPQGAPPQGVPQGAPPQGVPPQGVPQGAPPQGAPQQVPVPQGAPPGGGAPQGQPVPVPQG